MRCFRKATPYLSVLCLLGMAAFSAHASTSPNTCQQTTIIAAPYNLDGQAFYTDSGAGGHYSEANSEQQQQDALMSAPLRQYRETLSKWANLAQAGDMTYAACVEKWLLSWAQKKALLGTMANNQANNHRNWTLTALSMVWLSVRPLSTDDVHRQTIDQWLEQVLTAVDQRYKKQKDRLGNHRYFTAVSMAALGHALEKPELTNESTLIVKSAINTIDANGFIGTESNRGQKTLQYHSYAMAPLLLAFDLVGAPCFSQSEQDALIRAIRQINDGLTAPDIFSLQANAEQLIPKAGIPADWWQLLAKSTIPDVARYLHPSRIEANDPLLGGKVSQVIRLIEINTSPK